jgi:hypothetical protein
LFLKTLTGEVSLPTMAEMIEDTELEMKRKKEKGIPERCSL